MPSTHRFDVTGVQELIVTKKKTIRRASDLSPEESSQLAWLVDPSNTSKKVAFGNAKDLRSVEDCFSRRNVDDGIIFYKEMKPALGDVDAVGAADVRFHYWLGYFGGNPIGYLLINSKYFRGQDIEASVDTEDDLTIMVENCDGDFIWRGSDNNPKSFIKGVKKAALGSKYSEEED